MIKLICSILLATSSIASAVEGSKIVVYTPGQKPVTYESGYKIITDAEYEYYQAIKAKIKEAQSARKAKKANRPRTPQKKNRITLYAGVNQGALTVNESYRQDQTRDVTINQRSTGISGFGYSRTVWDSVSLSTIFLYQGIYVAGVGYDF